METTAIIVAAGRGQRAGGPVPKQFQSLGGQTVLRRTVASFLGHPAVDSVVVVIHPDDHAAVKSALGPLLPSCQIAIGGAERSASVMAGLDATPTGTKLVLIHDAARPLVSDRLISAVVATLGTAPGAAPALQVTDALWTGAEGHVTGTRDRAGLWRAQTPQGFHLDAIRAAHAAHPGGALDDVAVAIAAGLDVAIVEGEEKNLKITRPEDFDRARLLMGQDMRVGNGFDVHKFCEGDHVILCGIKVPFDKALSGHSDADVGMHAVTDAIYGALADGDIGQHFPPSDPQWKGAESHIFLTHAHDLARQMGYRISNIDCTLVCEYPKIGPHQAAMRAALAEVLAIDEDRISVKATTSERLGFTGREEGIAALATATLIKP